MYKKKSHFFNIDNLLISFDQKVWIIDKSKPNECLARIGKEDFDLIKSGSFKGDDISIIFNGKKYWISKEIMDTLKKRVKKLTTSEGLSFSFREYTDPSSVDGMEVSYNLESILDLKNSKDDIYFITTKGVEKRYGKYYTKLIDKLKEEGILVNKVYYLNQSYFSQNKDQNIKKIIYVLASNLSGKNIVNDELETNLDREYDEVLYYDSNYVTNYKIESQINSFLKRLDVNVTGKKFTIIHVGTNKLNPMRKIDVPLNKYIRTFEKFSFFKNNNDNPSFSGENFKTIYNNIKTSLNRLNIDYQESKEGSSVDFFFDNKFLIKLREVDKSIGKVNIKTYFTEILYKINDGKGFVMGNLIESSLFDYRSLLNFLEENK